MRRYGLVATRWGAWQLLWLFVSLADVAWASQRSNSDTVTGALLPPDAWDSLTYMSMDEGSSVRLAEITAKIKLIEDDLGDDKKIDDADDLFEYAKLYHQKFIGTYHRKIAAFKEAQAQWMSMGRKGNRPVFTLGDSKESLDKALSSYRRLVFDFDPEEHSPELYMAISRLWSLGRNKNAVIYLKKILKKIPKSPYRLESQLLLAENYFAEKDYAKASKTYSHLANASDNKIRLYALYRLAWLSYLGDSPQIEKVSERFKEVVRIGLNQGGRKYGAFLAGEAMSDLLKLWSDKRYLHLAEGFFQEIQYPEYYLYTLERLGRQSIKNQQFDAGMQFLQKIIDTSLVTKTNPFIHKLIVEILDAKQQYIPAVQTIFKMEELYLKKSLWTAANKEQLPGARMLMEELAGRFASKYYKLAKNENKELAKYVIALFDMSIRRFAAKDKLPHLRLKIAQLQAETGMHAKAAENYKVLIGEMPSNPDVQYVVSKNAVIELERALAQRSEAKPEGAHPLSQPLPIPTMTSDLLATIKAHSEKFKKGEFDTGLRYRAASIYYAYGHYLKAAEIWQALIAEEPASPLGQQAMADMSNYLTVGKKWEELITFATQLFTEQRVSDEKTLHRLSEDLQSATLLHAKQLAAKKDYATAILLLLAFQKRFPSAKQADKVLYLAYDLAEKTPELGKAIEIGGQFVRTYPSSQYAPELLWRLATTSAAVLEFESAAQLLATFVRSFPDHKDAAESFFLTAEFQQAAGNRDKAAALYEAFLKRFPGDVRASEALRKGVKAAIEIDHSQLASGIAQTYLQVVSAKKPSDAFLAQAIVAVASQADLQPLTESLLKAAPPLRLEAAKIIAGELTAQLVAMVQLESSIELDDTLDPQQIATEKKPKIAAAEALHQKIVSLGVPEALVMAHYQMAQLYATYSRKLSRLAPKDEKKAKTAIGNLTLAAQEMAERYFEFAKLILGKSLTNAGKEVFRGMAAYRSEFVLPRELTMRPTYTATSVQ